jgi:hypothetical protein
MDETTKQWIKAVLTNDEASSDEELENYLVKEGGLTPEQASQWVDLRSYYIRDMFCDIEPGDKVPQSPYILPTFNGYTVDRRLHQFRKAEFGKALEFIPFESPQGKNLLQDMKKFTETVQSKGTKE